MDRLDRELTLEIPQNMNLDTFAAHFFNSASDSGTPSRTVAAVQLLNGTAKATITSTDLHQHNRSVVVGNQFFQKLGETLFGLGTNSAGHSIRVSNSDISSVGGHNMDLLRNQVIIDSDDFASSATSNAANQLQQELEYDKFMNEIWIGIVLTLIIISMVFCICSCFLYHQFRQWKRNYRHNLQQTQDIESVKLNPDADDPVPEYTLVSGLPSYEAALELMQKTNVHNNGNGSSGSCLIVYPSSLFGAFMVNEKESLLMSQSQSQSQRPSTGITTSATEATIPQSPSIGGAVTATALLTTTTTTPTPTTPMTENVKCQNVARLAMQQYSIPSYEQAMGCQPQQQQQEHQQQQNQLYNDASTPTTCSVVKTPPPQNWSEDTTKVLLFEKKDEK